MLADYRPRLPDRLLDLAIALVRQPRARGLKSPMALPTDSCVRPAMSRAVLLIVLLSTMPPPPSLGVIQPLRCSERVVALGNLGAVEVLLGVEAVWKRIFSVSRVLSC